MKSTFHLKFKLMMILFLLTISHSYFTFSMNENTQQIDITEQVINIKYLRIDLIVKIIQGFQKNSDKKLRNVKIRYFTMENTDICEPKILVAGEKKSVEEITDLIVNKIDQEKWQ